MFAFALRKHFTTLHRWTGLTVGLLIVLMAVTGSINLLRPKLDPVVDRDLLSVPACSGQMPIESLAANAIAAHPGAALDYVRMNRAPEGADRIPATRIRFDDQVFVYLNPCTGDVLGQRHRYAGFLATVEQIHILRFGSDRTHITPIAAMIFAVVLVIGGIALWWPTRGRQFRDALRSPVGFPVGRARRLQLHKVTGVFSGIVLFTLVLTALPLSFEWYRHGLYTITGSPLPAKFPSSTLPVAGEAKRLPIDTIWAKAQQVAPNWNEVLIHFPAKPKAPYDMYLIERDAPHPNARTMLFFDAYNGKVLRHTPYPQSSAGHKLYFWTISFHTGQWGGWPVQLVQLAGALSIPVLAFTGITSWLRRRKMNAAPQRAATRSGQPS
jgi:uncharacterized iron-regulated membrane protein